MPSATLFNSESIATDPISTAMDPSTGIAPAKRRRSVWRSVGSAAILTVALVALWPAQFGGVTGLTVVNGHSMEPLYHTGDLVVSLRLPSYAPGDIVSYQVPAGQAGEGGRVIHRVFSIDASSGVAVYSTKGDNNPSVDPWHFGTNDVMGRALFSIPSMGSVLGGVTSPIAVGLASGLLVTVLLWRIGSAPRKRASRGSP